jgi:hypothetical protein
MLRWLRSLFAWRTVMRYGPWRYEENSITGARRVPGLDTMRKGGHNVHPGTRHWLAGGDFSFERPAPPRSHRLGSIAR